MSSAAESLMASAGKEDAKAELGVDAQFTRDGENVAVTAMPPIIGLTKEQLEEFRNNGFYKSLRYILFALFWVIWIALFAGAILLIVLSPRSVNEDKAWHQKANIYQAYVFGFNDANADGFGDFNGVAEKMEHLKELKVDTLLLTPVLKLHKDSLHPYEIADFNSVDERLGSHADLENLVTAAASYEVKLVADVPLSISNLTNELRPLAKGDDESRVFLSLDPNNQAVADLIVKTAVRLASYGFSGVYIHSPAALSSAEVSSLKKIAERIQDTVEKTEFAIFTSGGAVVSADLPGKVVLTEIDNQAIHEYVKFSNATTNEEVTRGIIANGVGSKRAEASTEDTAGNFAALLNAIRLFAYPVSFSFYGDEYGLRNTVAQSDLDEQLGHMLWLHADGANNGFSSLADDLLVKPLQSASEHEAVTETILKRFKGLSNLRSRLRHGVTFVGKNAIVRGNRDNSFYALFFNDQPTTETIEFSKMIPSDVAELLKSTTEITLDGADGSVMSDLSEATQKLAGYGYHIVKLHG